MGRGRHPAGADFHCPQLLGSVGFQGRAFAPRTLQSAGTCASCALRQRAGCPLFTRAVAFQARVLSPAFTMRDRPPPTLTRLSLPHSALSRLGFGGWHFLLCICLFTPSKIPQKDQCCVHLCVHLTAPSTTLQTWEAISNQYTHTPRKPIHFQKHPPTLPYLVFVRFFDLISACLFSPSCSFFSSVCHFFRHLPDGPRRPWIFHSSHL